MIASFDTLAKGLWFRLFTYSGELEILRDQAMEAAEFSPRFRRYI